jgi:GABA(A) receptor-associated protein
MNFKKNYSFEYRLAESSRITTKYPDRIPIICEKATSQRDIPTIDKNKYLVPFDLTIGQFVYVIRKRMKLKSEEALFLFISNFIAPSSCSLYELYHKFKDPDGFLYIQYSKENVFGSFYSYFLF